MDINPNCYPYPSKRTLVYGKNGMVATSQHLAAQAGLDILKKGGNAVDAAVATAACLTVVEPTSNGVGGDAFVIVWMKDKMYGLNSSGPAPSSISAEKVKELGFDKMPELGWLPVTVPGVPAAWAVLTEKFGNLTLKDNLMPAIAYAEEGYPVSPLISSIWQGTYDSYKKKLVGEQFKGWFDTFAPEGRGPKPGEIFRCKELANTLRLIAETSSKAFYEGELAERIDRFSREYGGFLRKEDLARFKPEWTEPARISYRGYDVWELPPNGQGIIALMALGILKGFNLDTDNPAETMHRQIEAVKLAFVDGLEYITDPKMMKIKVEELLSEGYADERRKLIGHEALTPRPGKPPAGGTVYLATVDAQGNMVSYIQSNYMGFGSGLVVPGTGISLQNRGSIFSLDPNHSNFLLPGKRTYHTIIPGFLTKEGTAIGPFGVMGGYMQPQGHVQVLMNMIDFHMNPQAALDAPRWRWLEGKTILVEKAMPSHLVENLSQRGHEIQYKDDLAFGRGQIILRDENGCLAGGTDPRADGAVAAW